MKLLIAVAVATLLVPFGLAQRDATRTTRGADAIDYQGRTSSSSTECRGVPLKPNGKWREAIRRAGPHKTFCFASGTYRLRRPIIARDGQKFIGQPGTVLTGAKVVKSFRKVARGWALKGQTQQEKTRGECAPSNYVACKFPEQVFFDNQPLRQVASAAKLAAGKFFFDYRADTIFLADDPAGHKVEVSIANAAFEGYAQHVKVSGFVVEKFANGAGTGAISGSDRIWTVTDNNVRLNHGAGIQVVRGSVKQNRVHHNGQIGIVGAYANGLVVANNDIHHNNTAGFDYAWEAGGTKWVHSTDLVVRNNYSHHNTGNGLWTDWNNLRTTYENNTVANNSAVGIFHESSYDAMITGNVIHDNGHGNIAWELDGAGIKVMSSSGVSIQDNTLIDNVAGIVLLQIERPNGPRGPFEVTNVEVTDNVIYAREGFTGLYQYDGDSAFEAARNNRFDRNTYYVLTPLERHFLWRSGERTWDEWRSDGQDPAGTLLPYPDTVLRMGGR